MDNQSPYRKVTEAISHPRFEPGRTRALLVRTPTRVRSLMRRTDEMLFKLEELNLRNILYMPTKLRVELFSLLLECEQDLDKIPWRVGIALNWVFKAQEYLMGIENSGEVYNLDE